LPFLKNQNGEDVVDGAGVDFYLVLGLKSSCISTMDFQTQHGFEKVSWNASKWYLLDLATI
jgi:hypothetical protein